MKSGITCSFCNSVFASNKTTVQKYSPSFNFRDSMGFASAHSLSVSSTDDTKDAVEIIFYLCPSCNKTSITVEGIGKEIKGNFMNFIPSSKAKQFPDYIPKSIISDYEESCGIVNLSPKASATLSRRCLQGMIRDYWKVTNQKNLYYEIDAIKDKVDPQVWKVLNSVRQIGNIGAHMEKDINLIIDIDPNEAEQLIQLNEYLIEQWYIKRHDTEELLNNIVKINDDKQEQRKS